MVLSRVVVGMDPVDRQEPMIVLPEPGYPDGPDGRECEEDCCEL